MSRILIIGHDRVDLVRAADALGYKFSASTLPGTITDYRGTYYLATADNYTSVRGYLWDRIESTELAFDHPRYAEFYAQALGSLDPKARHPALHWNRVPTERETAAVELAEAYLAWYHGLDTLPQEEWPETSDRLTGAREAWEKVR